MAYGYVIKAAGRGWLLARVKLESGRTGHPLTQDMHEAQRWLNLTLAQDYAESLTRYARESGDHRARFEVWSLEDSRLCWPSWQHVPQPQVPIN